MWTYAKRCYQASSTHDTVVDKLGTRETHRYDKRTDLCRYMNTQQTAQISWHNPRTKNDSWADLAFMKASFTRHRERWLGGRLHDLTSAESEKKTKKNIVFHFPPCKQNATTHTQHHHHQHQNYWIADGQHSAVWGLIFMNEKTSRHERINEISLTLTNTPSSDCASSVSPLQK